MRSASTNSGVLYEPGLQSDTMELSAADRSALQHAGGCGIEQKERRAFGCSGSHYGGAGREYDWEDFWGEAL